MPIQNYKFAFTVTMDMDAHDVLNLACELEQQINSWIEDNTPYDYSQIPIEVRRHMVQCVYDKIMSDEWKWE